jgi:hypothetical protein
VNGRFLLETNIVIALLEGDEAVLSNLENAAEVFVPAIALGELFFGAAKSGRSNASLVSLLILSRSTVFVDLFLLQPSRLPLAGGRVGLNGVIFYSEVDSRP